MTGLEIRKSLESDYPRIVALTRDAFWNLHVPGCDEHYLAEVMRFHPDYVAELAFVALRDGKIIGSIQYTRSWVETDAGARLETVTFGPLCVDPKHQRRGVGGSLIAHSGKAALAMGFGAVIILGHPKNYLKYGFHSSKDFDVSDAEGRFPYGLLALELKSGALAAGRFRYSTVYNRLDQKAVEAFDKGFEPRKKEHRPSQDEFALACRAYVE